MNLTPAQAKIALDRHRFRVLCCGRRFGKTFLCVQEIKGMALSDPKRICYIAPTYTQARDIVWEMLKRELKPIALSINESRLEIKCRTLNGGESLIVLRGWEAIENLRGQAFHFLVLDEVAMFRKFWVGWEEVLLPTLTDYKGSALFASTPKGYNHFYDLFNYALTEPDFASFQFSSYDNPHLPIEELDIKKKQMTEDRFAQEYMALFRKSEGLVYKEFDRTKHLYQDGTRINTIETFCGVDFGYHNPAAVPLIRRDAEGVYWVDGEYYKTHKTEEEVAEYVRSLPIQFAYPDSESPSAIEVLKRKGVNVRDVTKGKDSIESGIQVVREMFKQNRLRINAKCINLIEELERYHYPDETDAVRDREVPVKEKDHLLDALRYAIATREGQADVVQNRARTSLPASAGYNPSTRYPRGIV